MSRVLRLQLRRDLRQLAIWVAAVGLLVVGAGQAVLTEFPTDAERTSLLRLALATPAILAFRGVPNGTSDGSLLFFQLFSWLAVVVALLNTFLAARQGRGDEEAGRADLLLSTPVHRWTPLAATWVVGTTADVAVGLVAAAGFAGLGLPLAGSLVAGAALATTGFAFLGVGLLASQLAPTSRAANGLAGAVVGAAYLLRAAGDALADVDLEQLTARAAWPVWASPIGWGEQTFAFTDDRLAPLLPGLALGALTGGVALAVQARRDLGSSLLPQRAGRATAGRGLLTGLGLAWRLQRGAVLGWAVGSAVLGATAAVLSQAVADASLENAQVFEVLSSLAGGSGRVDVAQVFLSAVLALVGVLAGAAGLQSVLRLRADEVDGTAELRLSGPFSRWRWLAGALALAALAVLVVLAAAAGACALGLVLAGDGAQAGTAARQAFAGLPAALVLVGVGAALVGLVPRLAVGLAWALYAAAVVVGLFGDLLGLPDAVRDASPYSHVPTVPVDDWWPLVVLALVAAGLAAVAAPALRRRDLTS